MDRRLRILCTAVVIVALIGVAGPAAAATDPQVDGMVQDTLNALQSNGRVDASANVNILSITFWVNGEKKVISNPGSSVTVFVPTFNFIQFRFKGIYVGPAGTNGYMLCFFNDGVFRKHAKIIIPRTATTMEVDDFLNLIQSGQTIDVDFAIAGPASHPASTLTTVHFVAV